MAEKGTSQALKTLEVWQGKTGPMPEIKAYPALQAGTLYFIDKPQTTKSEICIGKRELNYDSILQFRNEISAFQVQGQTVKELEFVKSAIGQSDARNYERPRQKLNFLSEIITYNLDKGFVNIQNKILANIGIEETKRIGE